MSIIRGAISDVPFEKLYKYDQQFRLRMARDHTRSWAVIDGQLWLQFVATGNHVAYSNTARAALNRPCYDYNFKTYCTRMNCMFIHTCIRCGKFHPIVYCPLAQFSYNIRHPGVNPVRPVNPTVRFPQNLRSANPNSQATQRYPNFRPNSIRTTSNSFRFPGQQLNLPRF